MSEVIIEAGRAEHEYWRDLWRYRELFYFLVWRDLLVRYKQTVVGVAWAMIRPVLTIVILTVVFGLLGRMPSGGVPYPIVVFCGILPWQFFSTAVSDGGNSLVTNSHLISKVYFPRLVVPASTTITSFVDFLVSGLMLAGLMSWYHFVPSVNVLILPAFVLIALAVSLGAALWLSALMVKYRDIKLIVPFIVQFGLYISPVGFLSVVVPERWRLLYSLNPMVGVIDGFRWSILGGEHTIYWPGLVASLTAGMVLLSSGIWFFRKTERAFADVI